MKKFIGIVLSIAILFSINVEFTSSAASSASLKVHFIDVGQGDSEFIELPNKQTLLIDAGESNKGSTVSSYISSLGYKTINYVVATHPHSDHIGGMPTVFDDFVVKKCYAPEKSVSTATYKRFTKAVSDEGISMSYAYKGEYILNQANLKIKILSPTKTASYSDVNNYSAVLSITYYKYTFLFTGDASYSVLNPIAVKANVLKVSHHGSSTGTNKALLDTVKPTYAVISVGKGNSYHHPHESTLKLLSGITTYCTDLDKSVIATATSSSLKMSKSPKTKIDYSNYAVANKTVYLTKTGKCYHLSGCKSLSRSKIKTTLAKAISGSYKACSICKPPTRVIPITNQKPKISLKSGKKSVKISWKKLSKAKNYVVYIASKKSGKYKKIASTSKLSYTKKSLNSQKTYFFKVRGYTKFNSKGYYSKYSSVKYIKTK